MSDIELKLCPFCGGRAIITRNRGMFRVECLNRWEIKGKCPMNMRTHHESTPKKAAEAWNKRTS